MHTQQMSPEQVSVFFGFERKRHPENKLCTVSLAQPVLPHRTIVTLAIWPGLWCSFGPCLASRNAWNVSCQRHQLRQRCHLPGHSKATSFRTMLRGLRQGGTVGDVVKSQIDPVKDVSRSFRFQSLKLIVGLTSLLTN